jgi:tetratricopeptide (TPR) repeat protein
VDSRHFEFGPFSLDAERGVLTRDGAIVDAGQRAVLLLKALLLVSVFAGAFDQATRAAERAVELNPSFALGHLVLGMALVFSGDARAAIGPLEHGLTINPGDPQNFVWFNSLACALLFAGQPQRALGAAERALGIRPDWRPARESAVCCAAALGDAGRYGPHLQAWRHAMPVAIGDALSPLKRHNPQWAAAMAAALSGDAQPMQALSRPGGVAPAG